MALQVSKASLTRAHERLGSLQKRLQTVRKAAEHTTEKFLRNAETGGAAFALGVMQGKTGGVELMGMPLELWLGAGLNLAGYFGIAGKHSDHLNALGDGALAAYLTVMGVKVGAEWKAKSAAPAVAKGARLTREEIADAVAAAG